MREILFRGKRTDNSEWVEGRLLAKDVIVPTGQPFVVEANYIYADDLRGYAADPETVGQYTGLLDKDGKKIFEGDIFKFSDEVWDSCYTSCGMEYDSCEVENFGVVGYCEYSGRFDFVRYKFNENSVEADLHENNCIEFAEFVSELEVIGNIYDNPELLEG